MTAPETPAAVLSPQPAAGPQPGDAVWVEYSDQWLRGCVVARGASDVLDELWPGVRVRDGLLVKLDAGHGLPMRNGLDWDLLIPDAGSPMVRPGNEPKPRRLGAVS